MIYDCFVFFNELDVLDIRLHEMSKVVDKFVIVEATKTFQGVPKPLHYVENKDRFRAFDDKIIHVKVDFPEFIDNPFSRKYSAAWGRQYYQREQFARGLTSARPDDLVIVSDVDEIISASKLLESIQLRRRHDLTVFTMPLHSYALNRRRKKANLQIGPRMIEFSHFTSGQKMRKSKLYASRTMRRSIIISSLYTRLWNYFNCGIGSRVIEIPDAGWHLSSLGGWESYKDKVSAVSGYDEDRENIKVWDEEKFRQHVEETTVRIDFCELPEFVQANMDQFNYLCDC